MLDLVWLRLNHELPEDMRPFHKLDDIAGCFPFTPYTPEGFQGVDRTFVVEWSGVSYIAIGRVCRFAALCRSHNLGPWLLERVDCIRNRLRRFSLSGAEQVWNPVVCSAGR
jgi:hypothetical protein